MQRFIGLIGIVVILAIAYLLSTDRKKINFKTVGTGFLLQIALALFIFKVPLGQFLFLEIGKFIEKLLHFAIQGGQIVFGGLLETPFENEMPQKNIVLQKESDPMDSIENPKEIVETPQVENEQKEPIEIENKEIPKEENKEDKEENEYKIKILEKK